MVSADIIWTAPIINGSGRDTGENCSVELLGRAIYGDMRHLYDLPCIDHDAQVAMVAINDLTTVELKESRRWRLLIARLATCHATGSDRVAWRMELWAARSVEHLTDNFAVKECNDALERWLAGELSDDDLRAYADLAYVASCDPAVSHGQYCNAGQVSWAALLGGIEDIIPSASAAQALADSVGPFGNLNEVLIDWLDRYLDAWQKVAADEGEMVPQDMDDEYLEFVRSLDFLTEQDVSP